MKTGNFGENARIVLVGLMLLFTGLIAAAFLVGLASANPGRERTLLFSTYTSAEHHLTKSLIAYARDVERGTDGRIRIKIMPSESLLKPAQTFDGVTKGIADMGFSFFSYSAGRFPLMEVVDLPLPGIRDTRQASLVTWDMYRTFRPKELEGIKVLGLVSMAGGTLFTNRRVGDLEDMVNQHIRGTDNDASVIEALGGTAVSMPITEAYVALQKGIVDGILTDNAAMVTYRFGDVTRYKVDFPGGLRLSTAWYGMNLSVWNSLSSGDRQILEEVSSRYVGLLADSRNEADARGERYLQNAGVQLTKLQADEMGKWGQALDRLRERYVLEKTAIGLPARAALDFMVAGLKGDGRQ